MSGSAFHAETISMRSYTIYGSFVAKVTACAGDGIRDLGAHCQSRGGKGQRKRWLVARSCLIGVGSPMMSTSTACVPAGESFLSHALMGAADRSVGCRGFVGQNGQQIHHATKLLMVHLDHGLLM